MRNLKRALSLTLASVMLLGMMVVGSSAAAGYDDVADTDNVEAIEVLQAIEVMVGDERGFGPERPVNRAEMAVVMGKLLNLDYNYYATSCPFDDVYDWARGWVGACYANKIVSGRGEGVYDPGATVTAVEAASMLMRALGYFQYANDVADGFELSTVRQGTTIGIFDGVGSSATEPLTRNQVAQMVLNALQSAVVEPDGNTINLTTPDGTVLTGKVNYVSVTSNKPFARAISTVQATSIGSTNDSTIVELGERLYDGDLKLNDKDLDPFGRPARTWEYDGVEVGTYVKKELLRQTWTEKVTGRMLYDLLTKNTIETYTPYIAVDGETTPEVLTRSSIYNYYFNEKNLIRTNTEAVGGTGDGVITEVYVDTLNELYYIAVINTYLAKAAGDYNAKTEEAKFVVWALENQASPSAPVLVKNRTGGSKPVTTTLPVSSENFAVEDVKDSDIYLVQVADGEIQKMIDPEIIDNTKITSFKNGSWVVADGTKYTYNHALRYDAEVLDEYDDFNMKDTTYRLYLDPNSFVLGVEIVEEPDQYVFLTGLDPNGSNIANKTATGNVIFLDGTVDTVEVNMEKSKNADGSRLRTDSLMNTWCTYAVNSNGTYTLLEVAKTAKDFTETSKDKPYTEAGKTDKLGQGWTNGGNDAAEKKIDKKNIYLDGISSTNFKTVYGNDDSVYLTVDTIQINKAWSSANNSAQEKAIVIDSVEDVSVGIQSTSLLAWDANTVRSQCDNYDGSISNDDYVSHGIYTLFKDNGYVIAAVVVGEDDGANSHFAFVHSSGLDQEDWTADTTNRAKNEDGIYTWYRKVIMDGEEATLIEKTETEPEIGTTKNGGKMEEGNWYEVRFKTDGTVRKVIDLASKFEDETNLGYVYALQEINVPVNTKDTVLLYSQELKLNENSISYKGSTLQVETNDQDKAWGFPVAPNAKVVLLTDKTVDDQGRDKYSYVSTFTGAAGLDTAIKQVNENRNFWGTISAVLEGGLATQVIIDDWTATNINTGTGGNNNAAGNLLTGLPKSSANVDATINSQSGAMRMTLVYTAPEYAVRSNSNATPAVVGSTVTMPAIEVYTNGGKDYHSTITLSTNTGVVGADGKARFTYTSAPFAFWGVNIGDVTFRLAGSELLSKVQVRYQDKDGKALAGVVKPTGTLTTELSRTGAANILFKLDDSVWTSGDSFNYTISGVQETANLTDSGTIGSDETSTGTFRAAGNDYVTVKVTSALAANETKTLTFASDITNVGTNTQLALSTFGTVDAKDAALKLQLTPSKTSGIVAGDSVSMQAKMSGAVAGDSQNLAYIVTVSVNGVDYSVTLSTSNQDLVSESGKFFTVTDDIVIEKSDITVTAVPKMKVVSANWTGNTLKITFSNPVETATVKADGTTSNGNAVETAGTYTWKRKADTAAVQAVYTIDVSGKVQADVDTKKVDGVAIAWDTDLATTMGGFVTSYNGTAGKSYNASYSGTTLTLTAKVGGAVATAPTSEIGALTEATAGADKVVGGGALGAYSAGNTGAVVSDVTGKTVTVIFGASDVKAGDVVEIAADTIMADTEATNKIVKTTITVQADGTYKIETPA